MGVYFHTSIYLNIVKLFGIEQQDSRSIPGEVKMTLVETFSYERQNIDT